MRVYVFYVVCVWAAAASGVGGYGRQTGEVPSCNATGGGEEFGAEMRAVVERLRRLGVAAQAHWVRTADGVRLGAVRAGRRGGRVVVLAHGLLQHAGSWMDAGSTGLAPLLAERADLWLVSARGSVLTRVPNKPASWRFSADEMGRLDLPATIDYILCATGARSLTYIGYSQGGATFFIMCSELPHYCSKIDLMIALAPATRLRGMKSIARLLFQYFENNEKELNENNIWEVLPKGGIIQTLSENICKLSIKFCDLVKILYDGPNPGSVEDSTLRVAATGFPCGTSVRAMARYSQHLQSEHFQKYDYGVEQNYVHYGRSTPPVYNLSAVTVPTVIMYSKVDRLVDVSNIYWLVKRLPNVVAAVEVEDPMWSHLDFTMSRNIPRYVYPTIKKYLDKYT